MLEKINQNSFSQILNFSIPKYAYFLNVNRVKMYSVKIKLYVK